MPEFPDGTAVWKRHFSEHFPNEAIEKVEQNPMVRYGELLVYVIYQQDEGIDRRNVGFDPAESTEYSTHDPAEYVPDEFQADPGEIAFTDPFGLVDDDDALSEYDGWGDTPLTPTQTFATDVTVESCARCDGAQVYCTNCDDTGEADCTVSECQGGIVKLSCDACAGTGTRYKDCESCGGTGTQKERCTQCDGTGEYLNTTGPNAKIRNCKQCDYNGMMEIDCDACSGGSAPSGQRNVTCEGCGGTGTRSEEQCSTCSQYPETGAGTIPCPGCDSGTNPPECESCGGAGEESVVGWVKREYNLDVEWIELRRTEGEDDRRNANCNRSLISPPEFATQESELTCEPVESAQFFRDDISGTDVQLDVHPDRKHIQDIRHGARSPPDATRARGGPPWIFSEVSDKNMSPFHTRYRLSERNSDDEKSFVEFVSGCEQNRVSGGSDADDIIVPPADPFVKVYYRLVTAAEGTLIFNLSNLHEKHSEISRRSERVYYPTASVRKGDDGTYEVYDSHTGPKVKAAYESTGLLDRVTDLL